MGEEVRKLRTKRSCAEQRLRADGNSRAGFTARKSVLIQ